MTLSDIINKYKEMAIEEYSDWCKLKQAQLRASGLDPTLAKKRFIWDRFGSLADIPYILYGISYNLSTSRTPRDTGWLECVQQEGPAAINHILETCRAEHLKDGIHQILVAIML